MKYPIRIATLLCLYLMTCSCKDIPKNQEKVALNPLRDSSLTYSAYVPKATDRVISRSDYADKLYGFWLAQCIANWTGLVTEMDKVGNIGETKTDSLVNFFLTFYFIQISYNRIIE